MTFNCMPISIRQDSILFEIKMVNFATRIFQSIKNFVSFSDNFTHHPDVLALCTGNPCFLLESTAWIEERQQESHEVFIWA